MKEIINISIGQAGIQLTQSLIQLYLAQHNLNYQGKLIQQQTEILKTNSIDSMKQDILSSRKCQNLSAIFEDSKKNQQRKARFMLVDTQPTSIQHLLSHSQISPLLHSPYTHSTKQSANIFARGYYLNKNQQISQTYTNILQSMTEQCDSLQGLVLNHGIQGGTGSGTASVMGEVLADLFPKLQKTNFIVSYEPAMCNTPIAPYNTILALSKFQNLSDLTIMFDNFSLNSLFSKNLDIHSPNYKNLNNLISQVHSSYTISMRYTNNCIPLDMKKIQTSLVCYPRIHWTMPSFVPMIAEKDQSLPWTNNLTPNFLVKKSLDRSCQLFNQQYNLLTRFPRQFKKISSIVFGRGQINQLQFAQTSYSVAKQHKWMQFNPLGVSIGLSHHKISQIHLNEPHKQIKSSITSLTSTMQFNYYFSRINQFYDILYNRKSFVHWFLQAGMEQTQFVQARQDMAALELDYQEWDGSCECQDCDGHEHQG